MKRAKPRYPPEWKALSKRLRLHYGACQCTGECGDTHQTWCVPGGKCLAPNGTRIVRDPVEPQIWWYNGEEPSVQLLKTARKPVLVILTVAHLCDCDPLCAIETHLKPMCQRCHLKTDLALHTRHAAETRRRTMEANQLCLFAEAP
jgi:hypothetical protein